ncbi:hypothetical protein [Vibrio navarrensis]|uniref:hypothetical protein n=1 Tax=Vibrio navarrensis TaxID=29495 RepID=UPI0018DD024D|nr:hypothetical protein [Vibrio navarrensis]MBH9740668.1 hypothetical protein [Vibrio navarrensis]
MSKLAEEDLEFDFSDARQAFRFDCDDLHGASSKAQRVDFIAEYDDYYLFIEVKDPDNPGASNPEAFMAKLRNQKLEKSLAGKFRDTLFFRHLTSEHNQNKSIKYVVLLSCTAIEPAMLMAKRDLLYREIPLENPAWRNHRVADCILVNLQQYRDLFGENSVRRISEGAA